MPVSTDSFVALVLDHKGRLTRHLIEATSPDHAWRLAATLGPTVVNCVQAPRAGVMQHLLPKLRLNERAKLDTVSFSQDLATLMDAGVTVKEAVDALAHKESSPARRQVLSRLNESMSEGLSFSMALEQSREFPALLVATVAASEQTGDLATGLSRYARHQQNLRTVRDRVVGACVYPMLLLAVGSVVVLMLLGVVVPRFSRLLDTHNTELPALSQLLMAWGRLADTHPTVPWVVLSVFIAAVGLLMLQWRSADARKKWLAKLPGVAKLVREFQHLQMYRTTAILISRGVTIHKALVFSMELLSPPDRDRLRAGLARMYEGVSISIALFECGLSDVVATSMLNVAERSGSLPEMLDRIADFHERSLQRNIDIASRLIEPLLMIIFGIVIGGIVVLMYLPIFDLASSIS